MARRLFLHVGTIKSATTYLQAMCDDNTAALLERGLLWLGAAANFSAVADLYGTTREGEYGSGALSWAALVDRVDRHDGDALVSNELLSLRAPRKVDLLFASMPAAQPQVIITARDFGRIIVSQWQERVRHRPAGPWTEFMDRLTAADARRDPDVAWFWRRQDLPRVVEIWAARVGVDNVTIVTVPARGSGPDVIAERFFAAVGVSDAEALASPTITANPSLGTESVELVRRIQARLDDADRDRLHLVLKYIVTRRALADRAVEEPALSLTDRQLEWARVQADRMASELRSAGIRVIGDLDDLAPHDEPARPSEPSDSALVDAAIDALIRVAYAADDMARTVGPDRYGDMVRSVGGHGRPQP